jgi:hypothetical protein
LTHPGFINSATLREQRQPGALRPRPTNKTKKAHAWTPTAAVRPGYSSETVLRIPAAPGDSAAIAREIRLKVQVATFGNLDLLIVNMRERLAQVAHVERFGHRISEFGFCC